MTKKKKIIITAIAIPVALLLIIGIISGIGVYRYVSNVPKITPKQDTFYVFENTTLTPEDLVDIECNGEYEASFYIVDSGSNSIELSEDKSSLYLGPEKGTIHLQVCAIGKHSEGRTSDIIEVVVTNPDGN